MLRLTVARGGSCLTSGFASSFGSLELDATGDEVTRCRMRSRVVWSGIAPKRGEPAGVAVGVSLRLVEHEGARDGTREDGLDGGREAGLDAGSWVAVIAA